MRSVNQNSSRVPWVADSEVIRLLASRTGGRRRAGFGRSGDQHDPAQNRKDSNLLSQRQALAQRRMPMCDHRNQGVTAADHDRVCQTDFQRRTLEGIHVENRVEGKTDQSDDQCRMPQNRGRRRADSSGEESSRLMYAPGADFHQQVGHRIQQQGDDQRGYVFHGGSLHNGLVALEHREDEYNRPLFRARRNAERRLDGCEFPKPRVDWSSESMDRNLENRHSRLTAVVRLIGIGILSLVAMAGIAPAAPPEPEKTHPQTASVAPSVFLQAEARRDTLEIPLGTRAEFKLNADLTAQWSAVNVGPCVVRSTGRQDLVTFRLAESEIVASHRFDEPGWSLAAFSWGPAAERGKSDSWQRVTHCVKLIVHVLPDTNRSATAPESADPGFAARIGQKFEIVPFVPPPALTPGSDLPVRVYADLEKAPNVSVSAFGPDGSEQRMVTDASGITHFRITQAGRWLIRYETVRDLTGCTAELVFDVLSPSKEGRR